MHKTLFCFETMKCSLQANDRFWLNLAQVLKFQLKDYDDITQKY